MQGELASDGDMHKYRVRVTVYKLVSKSWGDNVVIWQDFFYLKVPEGWSKRHTEMW